MRTRFTILATATAMVLGLVALCGSAQAAPRGWKCSFSSAPIGVGPFGRHSRTYYYACYGKSLGETRARARRQCRRIYSCVTGACFPLDFTPARRCERES